jgi:hypothetical protein
MHCAYHTHSAPLCQLFKFLVLMGSKKERVGLWQSVWLYVANHIPI